jgi:hypothetical protein
VSSPRLSTVGAGRVADVTEARDQLDRGITEAAFQDTVVELAKYHGWRIAHFRPARTEKGWRTPMTGDPGFPDLVMVRRGRLVFAEMKRQSGRTTAEQGAWLSDLAFVGHRGAGIAEYPVVVEVFVWRPSDWDEIERVLG